MINSFIRVVETGSIAAAARAQGMSAAAISQSITGLETHLGAHLLSRTTRTMALTESGSRYYEKVRHIPHEIELAAQAAAVATAPHGPLCVATTSAFGHHVLAPLMPRFKAACPRIDTELISTDRHVDHRRERVDVSIRIAAKRELIRARQGLHIHIIGPGEEFTDDEGHFKTAYEPDVGDWTLIRPDGYVGAIVSAEHVDALESYLGQSGLSAMTG